MSQESVELRELAEAAFAALNSGDLTGFLTLISEDVEFTSLVAEIEGTTFRGHDGVRVTSAWRACWAAFRSNCRCGSPPGCEIAR